MTSKPTTTDVVDIPENVPQTKPISLDGRPPLTFRVKFFYSLGHVFNDLTCAIWFSYTLLFFQFRFHGSMAGTIILMGQIADAIASPLVGALSDRNYDSRIIRFFGRRKFWYLLGTVLSSICVPLFYNRCFLGEDSSTTVQFIYYSVLAVIWQGSWAAVQVGNISLINDLTTVTKERITLNSFRQAATIGANICLYTVTYFVITAVSYDSESETQTSPTSETQATGTIRREDLVIFTYVAYIVTAIGIVFSILFQCFVPEPEFAPAARQVRPSLAEVETKEYLSRTRGSQGIMTLLATRSDVTLEARKKSTGEFSIEFQRQIKQFTAASNNWRDWLRSMSFWKITLAYTFGRLLFNVTQVYSPLYLQHYLKLDKRTIAVNPFATYFAGLISSFLARPISNRYGSRVTVLVGACFGAATSVWLFLGGRGDSFRHYQIYAVSALMGVCSNSLIIGSTALNSDLIGSNTQSAAFVFATMSFVSKTVNGFVVAGLEQLQLSVTSENFYQIVMVALTGIPALGATLVMFTLWRSTYGRPTTSSRL